MTFHGVSFFTGNLAGNPYLNFIISNLVELVGITFIQLTVNKFGRKWPYAAAQCLSGLIFVFVFFIPSGFQLYNERNKVIFFKSIVLLEFPLWKTGMILSAKCAITFSFNSIYTITSEFYPTEIRNTLIAICVCIGKLGSVLVPFIHLYVRLFSWFEIKCHSNDDVNFFKGRVVF